MCDRHVEVPLGKSKSATSELPRFVEQRGYTCSFATPAAAGNLLESHVFDLILSLVRASIPEVRLP